jgi:hypothetical protein
MICVKTMKSFCHGKNLDPLVLQKKKLWKIYFIEKWVFFYCLDVLRKIFFYKINYFLYDFWVIMKKNNVCDINSNYDSDGYKRMIVRCGSGNNDNNKR